MRKVLFEANSFIKLLFAAISFGMLVCFMNLTPAAENTNIAMAFLRARDGFMNFWESEFHVDVLISMIWLFVIIPMLNHIITKDFGVIKAYVLVRLKKNEKWYFAKLGQIFAYSFFTSFIYHCTITLVLLSFKYKPENLLAFLKLFTFGTLTGCLFLVIFTCACFVLSFKLTSNISNFAVLGSFLVLTIFSMFVHTDAVEYIPILYYFISWHTEYCLMVDMFSYPEWSYYAVLLAILLAEVFLGKILIKKSDCI